MKVAIHQPNYAPWCGYFAKLAHADAFVFLDDVQMPQGRSYVSRVQIAANGEARWLTVPVTRRAKAPILDVVFAREEWYEDHLKGLRFTYGRAPHFDEVWAVIEPVYRAPTDRLADFNIRLIEAVTAYLGLAPSFHRSSELVPEGAGDARLISLTTAVGGHTYVSGQGGQNYQDPAHFQQAGLELDLRAYVPVAYDRAGKDFIAGLSVLDALFYRGRRTLDVLRYVT